MYRYGRGTHVEVDDPTRRFHLVEVIRAAGSREGERMAWVVMDFDAGTDAMDLQMYSTEDEARRALALTDDG